MLMAEKLANDEVRVLADKLQISVIEALLEPVLRPGLGRGSFGGHLERPFIFPRRTVAENYHLRKRKKKLDCMLISETKLLQRDPSKHLSAFANVFCPKFAASPPPPDSSARD